MPTARKPRPQTPADQRLYQKVAAMGEDAPVTLEEIAAFWGIGMTAAEKLVGDLPVAEPLYRVRRWRYGDVRQQFVDMVKAG